MVLMDRPVEVGESSSHCPQVDVGVPAATTVAPAPATVVIAGDHRVQVVHRRGSFDLELCQPFGIVDRTAPFQGLSLADGDRAESGEAPPLPVDAAARITDRDSMKAG